MQSCHQARELSHLDDGLRDINVAPSFHDLKPSNQALRAWFSTLRSDRHLAPSDSPPDVYRFLRAHQINCMQMSQRFLPKKTWRDHKQKKIEQIVVILIKMI